MYSDKIQISYFRQSGITSNERYLNATHKSQISFVLTLISKIHLNYFPIRLLRYAFSSKIFLYFTLTSNGKPL